MVTKIYILEANSSGMKKIRNFKKKQLDALLNDILGTKPFEAIRSQYGFNNGDSRMVSAKTDLFVINDDPFYIYKINLTIPEIVIQKEINTCNSILVYNRDRDVLYTNDWKGNRPELGRQGKYFIYEKLENLIKTCFLSFLSHFSQARKTISHVELSPHISHFRPTSFLLTFLIPVSR